ncbi:hypothetical protein EYR36_002977 [Pleurotus pulmonarius]|nr:hypothetical protein EYR36_002977 [Pleurotus pulmonarius]
MPALPAETLRTIFEYINGSKALLNILLTCRQFSQIADPLLYIQVTICDPAMTAKLQSLLDSIEANGRRALYVRSLLLPAQISDDEQVKLIDVLATKLKKLKTLSLPVATVPFAFLCQDPPFSLTEFRCPNPTSDQALARFLASQSSLETLQFIWDSQEAPDFSSATLPNLKTVMCNLAVFSHLAHSPARITYLAIQDLDETPWESTVAFTDRIRVLSLTLSDAYDIKLLLTFASVFPDLEWLEIAGPSDISKCLRKFSKYSGLEGIRGIRFRGPYQRSGQRDLQVCSAFWVLEKLEFVEYRGEGDDEYHRWHRDERESKRVKWACESDGERWRGDWKEDVSEVKEERPIRGSTPTRWRPYHAYGWPHLTSVASSESDSDSD